MLDDNAKVESRKLLIAELLRGNNVCVSISTTSMTPAILPGDTVTVSWVSPQNLRRGDIVLMEIGDEWVLHRIVWLDSKNERIVTRGDHAIETDAPAPFSVILGKVSAIGRKGREMPLRSPSALARLAMRLGAILNGTTSH